MRMSPKVRAVLAFVMVFAVLFLAMMLVADVSLISIAVVTVLAILVAAWAVRPRDDESDSETD